MDFIQLRLLLGGEDGLDFGGGVRLRVAHFFMQGFLVGAFLGHLGLNGGFHFRFLVGREVQLALQFGDAGRHHVGFLAFAILSFAFTAHGPDGYPERHNGREGPDE